MKKLLTILLAMVMTISMGMMLLACDPTEEHKHNYEWVDNGDGTHKQHCSEDGCDEPDIKNGNHDFKDGKCVCGAEDQGDEPIVHIYKWVDNGDGTHKQHCSIEGCDKPDINIGNHDFINNFCVCGKEKPDVSTVTFESLISNVNLERGLTIKVAANGEVDLMGALMGTPGEKSPLVISDETKLGLSNGAFKMDNEISVIIGEEGSGLAICPRIYIRNNKTYVGMADSADKSNDEIIFTVSEAAADENTSVTDQISEMLPMIIEELGPVVEELLKAPLPFTKDGEVFKAQVDVLTPVSQVVGMFAEFIKDITVDTTVGDLYTMIGGSDMLSGMLGEMTGKEAYTTILGAIKELPEGMIPAEGLAQIPETVDEFIAFVEEATQIDLPEMGDKTLAQYFDEVINLFKDITIFEIAYVPPQDPEIPGENPDIPAPAAMPELTPEELEAAKTAMQAELDAFKAQLSHIAKKLTTNKLVLSFEADRKGALASVKADITLDYEVMNTLISSIMGSIFAETETEPETDTNDMAALTVSITASVEYAATTFVDETKLVTEDTYKGSYKLVSVSETIGEEENAPTTSYKLGDKYGDVTLAADTVEFVVESVPSEWDPTMTELGYNFTLKMFNVETPFTDNGTMSMSTDKGYDFWPNDFEAEYTMQSIYINADGTFTLNMYYTDEDSVLHSFAFILEKAE